MKKTSIISIFLAALCFLTACSPSPTAVNAGGIKADASEYAFYLNYNRLTALGTPKLELARQAALEQIASAAAVRLKCKEFGLTLSKEQKQQLADRKEALIADFGGKAAYLEFLQENALTDRLYDKLQQNQLYYDMLYQYATTEMEPEAYTDEALRRFFSESYILVKYIRISLLDEEGNKLGSQEAAELRDVINLAHAAVSSGANFDDVMLEYSDDTEMSAHPGGLVVSDTEAAGKPWLQYAFGMKSGEVSGVLSFNDGYYIVKRLELSASYFEYNRDYILQSAQTHYFSRWMDQWRAAVDVKTTKVVDEIGFDNLTEYVK